MISKNSRRAGLAAALILAVGIVGHLPGTGRAATAEAVDRSALRVCADPSNPPFSTEAGDGFENKIAELLAKELGVPVRYTWYPDTMGFIRNTLRARKCDLVMGTTIANELLQNTNPYYRSAYSLVYRKDSDLSISSIDDPALKTLKIGAIAATPPIDLLVQKGLLTQLRPYQLLVDTRYYDPGHDLVHDVATGEIDIGIVWGPIAGYYAKREKTPLAVVPLRSQAGSLHLDYRITMGVRPNEPEWKHEINRLIRKTQPEINRILLDYGVPLLDEMGEPIKP